MAVHQMPGPKPLTVQIPDISPNIDGAYTLGVSGVGGQLGSHRISVMCISDFLAVVSDVHNTTLVLVEVAVADRLWPMVRHVSHVNASPANPSRFQ